MPTTVRLPKSLHRAKFRSPSVEPGTAVAEGDPIAAFYKGEKLELLRSSASGVLLRVLVTERIECEAGEPIALIGSAGEDVGYEPSNIECVRVEISHQCSECKNDYPVNGLVEEARCTRCGDVQLLGDAFWQEDVAEDVGFARVPGARGGGECLGGPTIECRGVPPFCRECATLLPMDALTAAWKEATEGRLARIECPSCKAPHAARRPPDWARRVFPDLVFVVGESTGEPRTDAPKPVVFKCPNCTASLEISGDKRLVRCQYCESDVFLPDELWLHFNPRAKKVQWWMLFEPRRQDLR